MQMFDSNRPAFRWPLAAVMALAVWAGAAGAANAGWLSDFLSGGKANDDNNVDISNFLKDEYCPPVEIRVGTESLVVYDRGHDGDESFVRFQASLSHLVRECHTTGDTMSVKVGVVGRLIAGPKGNAGSFTVPVRVAVVKQHGGNVLFSQMQKAPVSLSEPTFASDYRYVFDGITFKVSPDDRDLIIYVGYDAGKPKKPTPTG